MKLDKRIELATVECAGLHIGQCFALKRIVAADLQITDAVARSTQGNDLTSTIIERARDRDNTLRDLEERSHRISFAKQDLPLAPLPLASKGEQLRKADVIQGPAQVHRSADAVRRTFEVSSVALDALHLSCHSFRVRAVAARKKGGFRAGTVKLAGRGHGQADPARDQNHLNIDAKGLLRLVHGFLR